MTPSLGFGWAAALLRARYLSWQADRGNARSGLRHGLTKASLDARHLRWRGTCSNKRK
jgi:hypothetical protein